MRLVHHAVSSLAVALATAACAPDASVSVAIHSDATTDTIFVPSGDVTAASDAADTAPRVDTAPPVDTATAPTDATTATAIDTTTETAPDDATTPPPDDTATAPDDTAATAPDDTAATATDDTATATDDAADAASEVVDDDPYAPGALAYDKVGNIVAVDDLRRVVWDPSGTYALVLGATNQVLVYDPAADALASAGTLGTTLADLEAANEGGYFIVVGIANGQSTLWRVSLDADRQLVVEDTVALPVGTARAVVAEPGSSPTRFAIGAVGSTMYIGDLYLFDVKNGLSAAKGINTSAGLVDLWWGDPAIQSGAPHLVTLEGENGANSHSYILATGTLVGNGWGPGFGNPGRGAWRPDGGYGIAPGWTSNKLYLYDGAWTLATLPVPSGASPNAVAWRDHRRALVVGRVIASPPYAVVIDLRAGDAASWSGVMVDQSIHDFDKPPWSGNNGSMHLLDVAWRPGVACDEGLIVGTDNGTQFSPSFGLAIHFHDADDPACAP